MTFFRIYGISFYMKTDIFTFEMPADLIAHEPANPRDSSKLLHIQSTGKYAEYTTGQLDALLKKGDVLVFNNTKVIPARFFGIRGLAKIEITLFKQLNLNQWEALIKNARRLKINDIIELSPDFTAQVVEKLENGAIVLSFNKSGADLMAAFHHIGSMPLPPYINRKSGAKESDNHNYQTIYAKHEGAVAAPTAGLHFTDDLLNRLKNKGIDVIFVTLHVGGGTFLPVKVDDTDNHQMHAEYGIITQESADCLNKAKQEGRRIITVGTTSLRILESASDKVGHVKAFSGFTDIFITPGYQFKMVDMMFTNFHLSGSTLFMLVSAFAGIDTMKKAYNFAILNKYRFFSYGDACLIEKQQL